MWKDLYRYEGDRSRSWKIRLKYIFFVPGYTYTFFFRRAQNAGNVLSRFLWKVILRVISYTTHIQIPATTKIGEGFYIGHSGRVIINPKAVLGKNNNIATGVTIGQAMQEASILVLLLLVTM